MSSAPHRAAGASSAGQDPRDDWPGEARQLHDGLADIYGDRDALPTAAGAWLARQKSKHTRRAYGRAFGRWEAYSRCAGIHPLEADDSLASAFAEHLTAVPARIRTKDGTRSQDAPEEPPLSEPARAQIISACGSFYHYACEQGAVAANPFSTVERPRVPAHGRRVQIPSELYEWAVARAEDAGCTVNHVVATALRQYLSGQ